MIIYVRKTIPIGCWVPDGPTKLCFFLVLDKLVDFLLVFLQNK